MNNRGLSLHDVATLTGYSIATISRALNGKKSGNMKESTYKKIIKAVKDSGYIPNQLSAGLRLGITKIIGIIFPSNINPYYAVLSNLIERQAFSEGYLTYVCNSEYDAEKERVYIKHLKAQKVSMIFLCNSGLSFQEIEELDNNEKKIVLLDEEVKNYKGCSIVIDDFQGGVIGAEYLIARNRSDVIFIAGPRWLYSTKERLRGALFAFGKFGKTINKKNIFYGDNSFNSGVALMEEVLRRKMNFSAVFCFSDFIAMGVYKILNNHKISIPDEISIMGYDNIYFDELVTPSITTVATPVEKIAKIAINMIVNKSEYSQINKMVVEPYIIERESIVMKK
jgi:LacI family transcriptional regulator